MLDEMSNSRRKERTKVTKRLGRLLGPPRALQKNPLRDCAKIRSSNAQACNLSFGTGLRHITSNLSRIVTQLVCRWRNCMQRTYVARLRILQIGAMRIPLETKPWNYRRAQKKVAATRNLVSA
jgi:hypothetical protein